jgi:N,N-dimethylformamidase beta subunit-like protein
MRATTESPRKLISFLALIGLLALAAPAIPPRPAVAATDNPVTIENQQPGTTDWGLGDLVADDVSQQIKGYASLTSVLQGGSLTLNVTVHPAQTYSIDFYRIGWYGGDGGRLQLHAGPLTGVSQPACPADATTGLIACNWTPGYTLTIPPTWTSGVYMAVLTNAAGYQNYVNFVVRDGRPAPYLYQRSMNTAEAYNDFPDDQRTGKSLYEYNSYGANTVSGTTRAVKVSFDRPFDNDGSGDFFSWEFQFVRWVERSGYDVTYSTDLDTHENGSQLLLHKAFLSVGHDEYWSNEMRNAAETARDSGVNLAFFGANAVYWQVRYEASAGGGADRVMVCYKSAITDPVQGPTTTVEWRNAPVKRPEQQLTGLMYSNETQGHVNAPYVVKSSSNWVYANTGFKDGDSVPGLVGYEADRYMSSFPAPPGTNEVLLSQSPFTDAQGAANQSNSSIYQAPSGAWVFDSGTMSWSWALDSEGTANQPDPRIQQATTNILNRFGMGPAPVHHLKLVVPSNVTAGQAFSTSVTAEDAQGTPVSSYNGTVHFSSSDTSTGVVLPADSTLTNGQGSFSATLIRSGPQSLTVSDAANNLSTTANLGVIAGAATRMLLASGSSTTMAGSPVSFTVTAQDLYGNTDTSYAGTLHFSTSDPAPVSMPADARLTTGRGSFSATLRTVGSQTITATDTASSTITGRLTVLVNPGAAVSITMLVPGTVRANQTFSVPVTLKDAYGNVATGYTRTLHFSSSDMAAQGGGRLPADYTFTAADAGTHTFSMSLMTPPSQTITVADTGNASLSTTSRAINVTLF